MINGFNVSCIYVRFMDINFLSTEWVDCVAEPMKYYVVMHKSVPGGGCCGCKGWVGWWVGGGG